MKMKNKQNSKLHLPLEVIAGVTAGTILLAIYFAILTAANSFNHAFTQFKEMWYWISLLVVGFGIQAGLYFHIWKGLKMMASTGAATSSVAAAGGVSTTSMVACCAHHVTDVLPILGLSAAAVFFAQFQSLFMIIGILSNLIGINMMLKIVQEQGLYNKGKGIFSYLMRFDMKKMLYGTITFSGAVFLFALYNTI